MPKKENPVVTLAMKELTTNRHDGMRSTIELARAAVYLYDAATAIRNSSPDGLSDKNHWQMIDLLDQSGDCIHSFVQSYLEDLRADGCDISDIESA
jgi:hypothetical protein